MVALRRRAMPICYHGSENFYISCFSGRVFTIYKPGYPWRLPHFKGHFSAGNCPVGFSRPGGRQVPPTVDWPLMVGAVPGTCMAVKARLGVQLFSGELSGVFFRSGETR